MKIEIKNYFKLDKKEQGEINKNIKYFVSKYKTCIRIYKILNFLSPLSLQQSECYILYYNDSDQRNYGDINVTIETSIVTLRSDSGYYFIDSLEKEYPEEYEFIKNKLKYLYKKLSL